MGITSSFAYSYPDISCIVFHANAFFLMDIFLDEIETVSMSYELVNK